MKNRYKILILMLLAACFFVFSGCSARSAATPDEFQSKAEEIGYTVTSQDISGMDNISSYLQAEKGSAKIIFVEYKELSKAKEAYASLKSSIKSTIRIDSPKEQVLDSDTYCKYIVSVGDMYHAAVLNSNTMFYAKATSGDQAEIEQLLKDIEYLS